MHFKHLSLAVFTAFFSILGLTAFADDPVNLISNGTFAPKEGEAIAAKYYTAKTSLTDKFTSANPFQSIAENYFYGYYASNASAGTSEYKNGVYTTTRTADGSGCAFIGKNGVLCNEFTVPEGQAGIYHLRFWDRAYGSQSSLRTIYLFPTSEVGSKVIYPNNATQRALCWDHIVMFEVANSGNLVYTLEYKKQTFQQRDAWVYLEPGEYTLFIENISQYSANSVSTYTLTPIYLDDISLTKAESDVSFEIQSDSTKVTCAVSINGHDLGDATTAPANSFVKVLATPAEGYNYRYIAPYIPDGWKDNGDGSIYKYVKMTEASNTIVVPDPYALVEVPVSVTYDSEKVASVSVTSPFGEVTDSSYLNATITITAVAAEGYDWQTLPEGWTHIANQTIRKSFLVDENPFDVTISAPVVPSIFYHDGWTKTFENGDVVFAFTNARTHTFTIPKGVTSIDYLIVAGGGGGGGGRISGGGGAGGMLVSATPQAVTPGEDLTITVGAGGKGGQVKNSSSCYAGNNGGNSSLSGAGITEAITAIGGGGGGCASAAVYAGKAGGSGGGAAGGNATADYAGGAGTEGQGNAGGGPAATASKIAGSGGGGAGAIGKTGIAGYTGGTGGDGLPCSITGEEVYYAAGGGGGSNSTGCLGGKGGGGQGGTQNGTYAGGNATLSTGSGGGGAGYAYVVGGNGANGIVVIRYWAPPASVTVNITNDSDKDEYTATVDGTLIASGDEVLYGKTIVVVATPKTGYAYTTVPTDWTAGSVEGTITRNFTADEDPLAIAIPDPVRVYTLTLKTPENGSITGATAGQYAEGTVLELTAEPADGYRFAGWTDDAAGEEGNPLEVTMSADKTIGATFEQLAADERLVTYDGGENTDYSVKVENEDVASGSSVKVGKTIVALATPVAHYAFASTPEGWTACEPAGSLTKSFTVAADDIEFTIPSAAPIMHQLTITQPTVGSITGTASGSYIDGTAVSLTANLPDETYEFLGWTGDASGTVNPLEFTLTQPTAIGADIKKIARAVTFNTPENATVAATVDGDPITSGELVEYGKSVVVTSTPAEDFEYLTTPDGWAKSGEAITRTYPVTDQAIDIVIEAPIAIQYYTLTINQAEGGTISGAESGSYKHDTSVTLTATAAAGYKFIHWTGVPIADARTNPLTVKMTEDKTIGAIFRADSVYDQYAQDGLITMWDCKTGYTSEGWSDINGEHQWLFTKAFPDSAANGVDFDGTGYGALSTEFCESTFGLCKKGTMEIVVVREETSGNRCALNVKSTYGSQSLYFYEGEYCCAESGSLHTMTEDATLLRTVSAGYDGSGGQNLSYIYMNGEKAEQNGTVKFTAGSITAGATLGHRRYLDYSNYVFKGRILAIRLYSGKLTKEQVIANAKLDRERFLEKVDVSVTCSDKQTYTAKVCGLDIENGKTYTNNTITVVATPVAGYVYETVPEGWTQQGGRITKDFKTVNDPTAITIPEATKDARVAGFMKKVELTLNTTLATTEIKGLPTLVRLDPAKIPGFRYSSFRQAKGADMLFTYAGEVIPHEVDTWNTAGESLVWVKLPSTAENTKITMFYGGSTAFVNDPTAVWSGYEGVWHLNEDSDGVKDTTVHDSTANGYDGTAYAGDTANGQTVAGKLGNGWQISSDTKMTGGGIVIDSMATTKLGTQFTVSGWLYHHADSNHWDHIFYRKAKAADTNGFCSEIAAGENTWAGLTVRGAQTSSTASGLALSTSVRGGWSHAALTFDSKKAYLVNDGGTSAYGTLTVSASDNDVAISFGNNNMHSDSVWCGSMDELRIRKGAYDSNYLKAEYKAMNVGETDIFTFGKVESKGAFTLIIK